MTWVKQSTARTIKFGPFIDPTTGAAKTGLSIAQADIRLSKNGGNIAQSNNSAGATEDENGMYDIPLDTTDTNTLGILTVLVNKTGASPLALDYMVVPPNVFDSLILGVEWLSVTEKQPEWAIVTGVLTVKKQDDTTTQYTKNVGSTPGSDPITSVS